LRAKYFPSRLAFVSWICVDPFLLTVLVVSARLAIVIADIQVKMVPIANGAIDATKTEGELRLVWHRHQAWNSPINRANEAMTSRWYLECVPTLLGAVLAAAFCSQTLNTQQDEIVPGANLEVYGIPNPPGSLAQAVKHYTNAYGLPLAGWDPVKREVWLKGISSATWISRVNAPGAVPVVTGYIQNPGIYDVYVQPQGNASTRPSSSKVPLAADGCFDRVVSTIRLNDYVDRQARAAFRALTFPGWRP
jgi:hypothetical protein